MGNFRLGIDIGGTFTDLVVFEEDTKLYYTNKVSTTPHNLAEGVLESVEKYVGNFEEIEYFVHGTTSGLNAFLERKGAKVALIVTEGFRDVYEIGRANRTDMYNIQYNHPPLLLERKDIYEISERTNVDGNIEKPVDVQELKTLVKDIKEQGYEAVAVCLLHSYKNPSNEQEINRVFEQTMNIPISLSSDIAREWREYERVSTTVINAYIAPIVRNYLIILEKKLRERGFNRDLYIMQSNGGVMTAKVAQKLPLQTLMSGPVGGAIGGMNLTKLTGNKNLICVDMGGTSFDVSLIIDGQPDVTSETQMEGFPILSPMVNMHTIGAGGGSIAYIESGGLRVGPKSAGSSPGPACYGRGGQQPTVTDANLVLGRVDENNFLGGAMKLDKEAAVKSVALVAKQIGLSVEETAEGICDIANAKMADAIRTLTVKRGIDPRDFTLVAFGGAGPMHAVLIAGLLEMNRVFIPSVSGTFSAWGMLQTDIRFDTVRNFVELMNHVNLDDLEINFNNMENESILMLKEQNIESKHVIFQRSADIRYLGQEYTVNVELQSNDLEDLEERFHQIHQDIYGHNNPEGVTEIVNLRMTAIGELEKIEFINSEEKEYKEAVPKGQKKVIWDKEGQITEIYSTEEFKYGHYFNGPAIIEDKNSTVVIPPNYHISIDSYQNIEIEKSRERMEMKI